MNTAFTSVMKNNLTIKTEKQDLELRSLATDNVELYYSLIDQNRDFLTRHGDYSEMKEATLSSVSASMNDPVDRNLKFGIWLSDRLIGRVDLIPYDPGIFGIGYWLGESFTGKGYATLTCRALLEYAERELGAHEVYAGVTKGNAASERLLKRLGFEFVKDMGKYSRFRLAF